MGDKKKKLGGCHLKCLKGLAFIQGSSGYPKNGIKISFIFWAIPFHSFLRLYGRLMKNVGGLRKQRTPSELYQNAQ